MSEDSTSEANELSVPIIYPKYTWQVKTNRIFVYPESFDPITVTQLLETDQKTVIFPTRIKVAFPIQTIQPKVQQKRIVPHKELPLAVEQERKRRYYASISLQKLLLQYDIDEYTIYPVHILQKLFPELYSSEQIIQQDFFLPLKWFVNDDFDEFTEESWLKLAFVDNKQHALPALAFVPNIPFTKENNDTINDQLDIIRENFKNENLELKRKNLFIWRMVAVYDYDEKDNLWIIKDLENSYIYKMQRLHLTFVAENPFNYALRLKTALISRVDYQKLLQFELMLDTLLLLSDLPQFNTKLMTKILKTINRNYNVNKIIIDRLKNEINLNYQRLMLKYEFKNYIVKHPGDFELFVNIDKLEKQINSYPIFNKVDKFEQVNLKSLINQLHFNSIFFIPYPVLAMSLVCTECLKTEQMLLYSWTALKPLSLHDFKTTQNLTSFLTVKYIKGFWVDTTAKHILLCLRPIGKGWVDIAYAQHTVYTYSKMYKFLAQVKYRMENALRTVIENSILTLCHLVCTPCIGLYDIIDENYEWPENFIINPYKQHGPPIFYLTININSDGYVYSTNINDFSPVIIGIYSEALQQLCYVELVDRQVMHNITFSPNLYLDCGMDIDDLYKVKFYHIEYSLKKSIIPLEAYGRKYNEFVTLYMLNISEYISKLKTMNVSAAELKETILNHKRLKRELIEKLPLSMIIGPYFINCEILKKILIKKRTQIIDALLDYFTDRMLTINEDLLEKFDEINNRLNEKPLSIEHVYELKAFIVKIPEKLEILEDKLRIMFIEYDILDYFFHNLSDDQFKKKWLAYGYPYRITQKIGETNEEHKNDIEVFKKIQFIELSAFQDRLENLNDEVNQFSLKFDSSKGEEMSVEAKRIMKSIKDALTTGELLAKRQLLFDMDPVSLEFINQIKNSFQPYYNLWLNGQKFLGLVDLCLGNTLISLDINSIKSQIDAIVKVLEESKKIFEEKIEFISVADHYLSLIESFKPSIYIIDCIKDDNWLPVHWMELSQKAKMDIKYTPALNLLFCIKKGILEHPDVVKEVLENAILQADTLRQQYEEEERARIEKERLEAEKRGKRKCRTDIL